MWGILMLKKAFSVHLNSNVPKGSLNFYLLNWVELPSSFVKMPNLGSLPIGLGSPSEIVGT